MRGRASIVIATASVGSGHRLAAEALARELASDESLSACMIDALELAPAWAVRLADGGLTASPLGRQAVRLATPLVATASHRLAERILAEQPAVIVSTHPLTTAVAARLAASGRTRACVVTVPTDFDVSGATPRHGVELHCVATDRCAAVLAARGVPEASVKVTGIPVRAQFTVEYDTEAARSHFGLPNDRRVVLAVAGAGTPESYARLKEALAVSLPALASLPDTAVAIVTGNDAAFSAEITSRSKGFGTTNVRIFDYVEHMAPLMACADLVIARPGGMVCAECIDTGVPLVLVGPAYGHERANARTLAQAGAAAFAEDPTRLAEHARTVLASPGRLAGMRESAAQLARPFAAAEIASHIRRLAGVDG